MLAVHLGMMMRIGSGEGVVILRCQDGLHYQENQHEEIYCFFSFYYVLFITFWSPLVSSIKSKPNFVNVSR
jgi:hypothetical protein